eukprot:CFRG1737T1
MSSETMDVDTPTTTTPQCSFNISYVVKRSHAQHGLRHEDYNRYRHYCTRRIHRLRKVLKLSNGSKKFSRRNILSSDLTTGEGRENVLQIPLFEAERCWAYAMELKATMGMELKRSAAEGHRMSHHVRNKLKVAAKHASVLEDLCSNSDFCDERTGLEAKAYGSWMNGILAFELQNWEEALRLLNLAKKIWKQFSETYRSDDLKTMYLQRIETLEPTLRYCAYSLGDNTLLEDLLAMKNVDQSVLAKLERVVADKDDNTFKITWRNQDILVPNDKVRLAIVRFQEKTKAIKMAHVTEETSIRDIIKMYDSVFMSLQDALQTYRSEKAKEGVSKMSKEGATVLVGGGGGDANEIPKIIELYLNCMRYHLQNDRNQLMIDAPRVVGSNAEKGRTMFSSSNKPEENVRLYSSIIQNVSEMMSLVRETDASYYAELEVHTETYQALRCFCIANAYAHSNRLADADVVYDLTASRIASISMALNASDIHEDAKQALVQKIQKLAQDVRGRKCMLRAAQLVATSSSRESAATGTKVSVVDRLDVYEDDFSRLQLASFPPSLKQIPCKPLFFDVAMANMPIPDFDNNNMEPKQGISGLVSSMFGGWGVQRN